MTVLANRCWQLKAVENDLRWVVCDENECPRRKTGVNSRKRVLVLENGSEMCLGGLKNVWKGQKHVRTRSSALKRFETRWDTLQSSGMVGMDLESRLGAVTVRYEQRRSKTAVGS